MLDFVWVVHESLPDAAPTQVSAEAFALVWSMRGFVPCDAPVDDTAEAVAALLKQGDAKKVTARKSTTAPAAPSGDEKE